MKLVPVLLLFIFLLNITSVAGARDRETYMVSPTGENDQDVINRATKEAYENGGGIVYLEAGVYDIRNPVYIGSNTVLAGDKNAILRVNGKSSQWFVGTVGIINPLNFPLKNVEVCGFQIDGNLDELPTSYADSDGGDHNCERAIYLRGISNDFMDNISIHHLQIYDCYSDGIHLLFATNVECYSNFVSNCQHSGIFFVSVVDGIVTRNKVAGITSDCIRHDNCENIIGTKNILYSYTGSNSNGAYQKGENGLQVGDQGFSHGGGSDKPTTTKNIEYFDNIFANTGLRPVWIDAAGKGVENVYLHNNTVLNGSDISTMGLPVDISYNNPPSKELSERIFSSIFDILFLDFDDELSTSQKPEGYELSASVNVAILNNTANPQTRYFVDADNWTTKISYEYEGNETWHLIRTCVKGSDVLEEVDMWKNEGDAGNIGDVYFVSPALIPDDVDNVKITIYNAFGEKLEIETYNVTVHEEDLKSAVNPLAYIFLYALSVVSLAIIAEIRIIRRKLWRRY